MKVLVIQHVSYESSGILAPYLGKSGHKVSHLRLYQPNARFSKDLLKNDLFVFMGGPMSVNEEEKFPFLINENRFILDLLDKNKAILGVCLGSQLLAKALGSKIYKAREKEIGWYDVDSTKAGLRDTCFKRLSRDVNGNLRVFHWHGETFDLPKNAVLLAGSKSCPNQAFRYGRKAYAVQFHLEMNRPLINRWLKHGRKEILENGFKPDQIDKESDKFLPDYQANAKVFFDTLIEKAAD